MSWRRRIQILGTLASLGLLFWLLSSQDWRLLLQNLARIPASSLIAALLLVFGRQAAASLRWTLLARAQGIRVGYLQFLQLVLAGMFASNFLPTTVGGDIVRVAGLIRHSSNRLSVAASVVMDRVVGLTGMIFVLPFSLPLLQGFLAASPPLVAASVAEGSPLAQMLRTLRSRIWETARLWFRKPASLLMALLASWTGVSLYLGSVWIIAWGLGIPVGYWDVAGATALTYFLTLIPFSINGYGLRELGVLALYTRLGASPEQAAALALITRGLLLAVSLPGAVWVGTVIRELAAPVLVSGDGEA